MAKKKEEVLEEEVKNEEVKEIKPEEINEELVEQYKEMNEEEGIQDTFNEDSLEELVGEGEPENVEVFNED